jgi:hypothetical protein
MSEEIESSYYDGPWSNNISAIVGTHTYEFVKLSVGDLSVHDNKDMYLYKPQEDITTYELSMLLRLFVVAINSSGHPYDYWGFVKEHKLERHFEKK